jgi:phosphatidylinositol alpha-mannosyltransferase
VPYNGSIARLAFGPRVAARVGVALRRARPDVVHVHEPFAPSVGLLAVLRSRAPAVATFHASAPSSRAYRAAAPALRPLYRRLAARIAVSDEARRTVERIFGNSIHVIPNGVDLERFSSVPPPAGSMILFIGRLEPRKGARVLVDSFVRLRERGVGASLVIVGEGGERAACEWAVPDALRDDVTFVGRVDPAELATVIGHAAVVCTPSLGGESFGIVLLEAMAAGRPVVATSIPGYAAVARDGVDALLVPPGDAGALASALERVVTDPALGLRLGLSGRERARRYDWPVVAGEVEEVYREALAAVPKRRRRRRRR